MSSMTMSRSVALSGPSACAAADLRASSLSSNLATTPSPVGQRLPMLGFSGSKQNCSRRACRVVSVRALTNNEVDIEKVQPMGDRLFVRVDDAPQATAGGILLPKSSTSSEKFLLGEVLAVGKEASGAYSKGQRVLFTDLHTQEVNLGSRKDKLAFVKAKDLLGVVE
ncbi:chaperonin 10 Kd subunit [Klebsormidium nitens]|uniref:Chaperonin 10 Kd subunit n=1 Tax=Klebsormidium nitens TaxID=105231 RepID=A0A1Y1IAS1_KLENI|nr:chaperonin 10 Kd subunit [Klebsormidium nitens]|eukprot:GAQ87663.1 chaperonin 10 Kd subunit [Klebsormidium nitens]